MEELQSRHLTTLRVEADWRAMSDADTTYVVHEIL